MRKYIPEVESRTQGSRPRPRTQKNFEAKDKPSRGQGQGTRTQAQVFSKKKVFKKIFQVISKLGLQKKFQAKMVFKIFFLGDFHVRKAKKGLCKFSARFLALSKKISPVQKIVLSSSRSQGNFRGLEASRPRQGLENVSSRTSSWPRTSSRTPPLIYI